VTAAYVTSRRPVDVAREVERLRQAGCLKFVLRQLDGGEMLDRERLGAARYAAGLQAEFELEGARPGGSAEASGVGTPVVAVAR